MEKIILECGSQGLGFDDNDYLELMFMMSEAGHKLLVLNHLETEAFSCMASHLVVRLVNSGHDDVAYNLVQYTVDQSTEEEGHRGVPPADCQVRQQLELSKCVLSF